VVFFCYGTQKSVKISRDCEKKKKRSILGNKKKIKKKRKKVVIRIELENQIKKKVKKSSIIKIIFKLVE